MVWESSQSLCAQILAGEIGASMTVVYDKDKKPRRWLKVERRLKKKKVERWKRAQARDDRRKV
jgi:hypothetical protein